MEDSIKYKGIIDFKLIHLDGSVEKWSVNNLIMNAGLAEIANCVGNVSTPTSFGYLALGTSSTAVAASQTALQAETTATGLARATSTNTRVTTTITNDTLQLYKLFTNTSGSSVTINEVGVFNASSNGLMLARALTGSKEILNGEKIEVTYKIKFS